MPGKRQKPGLLNLRRPGSTHLHPPLGPVTTSLIGQEAALLIHPLPLVQGFHWTLGKIQRATRRGIRDEALALESWKTGLFMAPSQQHLLLPDPPLPRGRGKEQGWNFSLLQADTSWVTTDHQPQSLGLGLGLCLRDGETEAQKRWDFAKSLCGVEAASGLESWRLTTPKLCPQITSLCHPLPVTTAFAGRVCTL